MDDDPSKCKADAKVEMCSACTTLRDPLSLGERR
jgi:hypothetical protein